MPGQVIWRVGGRPGHITKAFKSWGRDRVGWRGAERARAGPGDGHVFLSFRHPVQLVRGGVSVRPNAGCTRVDSRAGGVDPATRGATRPCHGSRKGRGGELVRQFIPLIPRGW